MRLTALNDTRDYGADERNGEGVVDVELKRSLSVVVAVMRQDVEKCPHQI